MGDRNLCSEGPKVRKFGSDFIPWPKEPRDLMSLGWHPEESEVFVHSVIKLFRGESIFRHRLDNQDTEHVGSTFRKWTVELVVVSDGQKSRLRQTNISF